jgi:sensor domain CHASE-containing protein
MKLHAKVIALLIGLFAAYGAIDYSIQKRVIMPSFTALESELARTDMQRVSHALDGEAAALLVFCADWGNWLDAYRFMQTRYDRFIDENMAPATIQAVHLNLVAFIEPNGRYVWRAGFVTPGPTEARFKLLEPASFEGASVFREAIAQGRQASGVVQTEYGPALIAVAPVLDGLGNGPHEGAALIGRLITQELIGKIAKQAQVELRMLVPARAALSGVTDNDPTAIRIVQRGKTNEIYRTVLDASGQPALTFKVNAPRSISERGEAAVRYASLSLLVAGASVLFVLLMALRRLILRPVSRMTRHAVSIGESDDLTLRLNVQRSDELGALAREFDRMLGRFADARRRLVDKSFEAGLAEMASGVLHNVGNALTPIAVKSSSIQQTLAELPVSDLQRVLHELERGVQDPSRRNDLQEFLRLAAAETVKVNERISDDVKAIANGVLAIQAMLNDRAQYARTGPVIEAVRLEDVIRQALLLVPPQRLTTVDVVIDSSVAALGTVLLARVTLQQVFQNLIVNACEAMPAGVRGNISVSARVTGSDGERKLQVMFSDNGAGIAPEHLSTIFNKGFSTKPLENNSGLGLHWSANIVASLGGRIYAESPGADGGAVFHVILPLQNTVYDRGAIAA